MRLHLVRIVAVSLGGLFLSWGTAGSGLADARSIEHRSVPKGVTNVAPGKVRFSQTSTGQWREFVPKWEGGRSLIDRGGFAVYARDEAGQWVELSRSGGDGVTAAFAAGGGDKLFEGTPGGFRAPSLDPDDDHDGRVDEDRLDGVDNDGDGAADEDFAAIGDEMVVVGYQAHGKESAYELEFHQEAYAWSLPNLDGVVMLSLTVGNTGTSVLQDVCVVAFYEKHGRFSLSGRSVGSGSPSDGTTAHSVIVTENGGDMLAMISFPGDAGSGSTWRSGYGEQSMATAVARVLGSAGAMHRKDADTAPGEDSLVEIEEGATVFCVSSPIDRLGPGDVLRVDVALAVAPPGQDVFDVVEDAFRTYLGDGSNRYIPPPVSMTPRLIWGTYTVDPTNAILVTLDGWNDDAVKADDISYFTGVRPTTMTTQRNPAGNSQLVIRGGIADDIGGQQRFTLRGRLESGEFFELRLRPEVDTGVPPAPEVETFWRTPGKLPANLLRGSPNPFRNSTSVFYEIPALTEREDGSVAQSTGPYGTSVKVYNVSGRLVSVLVENNLYPGSYSIDWAATDDQGNAVASGVYYLKLQVEQRSVTKRLILLK